MDIPTIFDLLERLAFLRGMPSVVIILTAAFVAVAAWDMRVVIPALLVQYLFAGLLFVDVLDPRLAVVYTLAGLFVTAILTVTARQVNWGRSPAGLTHEDEVRLGLPRPRKIGLINVSDRALLRLALAALVFAGALWAGQTSSLPLPVIPDTLPYLNSAIIGLAGLGLVGLATTIDPLPAGAGLLLLLVGFALFYGFLDQSIVMTIALVIVQLAVALTISYLAQARYLPADVLD